MDLKIIKTFDIILRKNILLKLQFPQIMKIHNIFHLNLLHKA